MDDMFDPFSIIPDIDSKDSFKNVNDFFKNHEKKTKIENISNGTNKIHKEEPKKKLIDINKTSDEIKTNPDYSQQEELKYNPENLTNNNIIFNLSNFNFKSHFLI